MKKFLFAIALLSGCSKPCPQKPVQTQPVCDRFGSSELQFYNCSLNDVDYLCILIGREYKCWIVETHDLGYTPAPADFGYRLGSGM